MKNQQKQKHWIEDAIAHAGSLHAAAKRTGKTTAEFAEEHAGDTGTTGRRARLAETLMRLNKKKQR